MPQVDCLFLQTSFVFYGLGNPQWQFKNWAIVPERVPPFWLIPSFSPAGSARLAEELRQKWLHALITVSEGNWGIRAVPQKNLLHVRRSYWRNITCVRKDGTRMEPWLAAMVHRLVSCVCVLLMWVCCIYKHTCERRTVYFSLLKSSVSVVHTTIVHTTMQKKCVLQKLDGACKSDWLRPAKSLLENGKRLKHHRRSDHSELLRLSCCWKHSLSKVWTFANIEAKESFRFNKI